MKWTAEDTARLVDVPECASRVKSQVSPFLQVEGDKKSPSIHSRVHSWAYAPPDAWFSSLELDLQWSIPFP
jgi:hypothetical protein